LQVINTRPLLFCVVIIQAVVCFNCDLRLVALFLLNALFIIKHAATRKMFCSFDCDSIIVKKLNKSSHFLKLTQKQHNEQGKTPVQNLYNKNQKNTQKNIKNNKNVIKKT